MPDGHLAAHGFGVFILHQCEQLRRLLAAQFGCGGQGAEHADVAQREHHFADVAQLEAFEHQVE